MARFMKRFKSRAASRTWEKWKRQDQRHLIRSTFSSFLRDVDYKTPPDPRLGAFDDLRMAMDQKVVNRKLGFAVPFHDAWSAKIFRAKVSETLLRYPGHPIEVQTYIGIFSWLITLVLERLPHTDEMTQHIEIFQNLFVAEQPQPVDVLHGLSNILREAYTHFHPVLANLIITSSLDWITSNAISRTVRSFGTHPYELEPDPCRTMGTGIQTAFAAFTYPESLYPDIQYFLETLPDMAGFLDNFQKMVIFYENEVDLDSAPATWSRIHDKAIRAGKEPIDVFKEAKHETVKCSNHIYGFWAGHLNRFEGWGPRMRVWQEQMAKMHMLPPPLDGCEPYERAWWEHAMAYISINLEKMGLDEDLAIYGNS